MAKSLKLQLREAGIDCSDVGFRAIVREAKKAIKPDWSEERVLCNPPVAESLIAEVRRKVGAKTHPELILMTLLNLHKANEAKKRRRKERV